MQKAVNKTNFMFRAIGFLITLYGLATFFDTAFVAFERAATESFKTIEAAAILSQQEMQNR